MLFSFPDFTNTKINELYTKSQETIDNSDKCTHGKPTDLIEIKAFIDIFYLQSDLRSKFWSVIVSSTRKAPIVYCQHRCLWKAFCFCPFLLSLMTYILVMIDMNLINLHPFVTSLRMWIKTKQHIVFICIPSYRWNPLPL